MGNENDYSFSQSLVSGGVEKSLELCRFCGHFHFHDPVLVGIGVDAFRGHPFEDLVYGPRRFRSRREKVAGGLHRLNGSENLLCSPPRRRLKGMSVRYDVAGVRVRCAQSGDSYSWRCRLREFQPIWHGIPCVTQIVFTSAHIFCGF